MVTTRSQQNYDYNKKKHDYNRVTTKPWSQQGLNKLWLQQNHGHSKVTTNYGHNKTMVTTGHNKLWLQQKHGHNKVTTKLRSQQKGARGHSGDKKSQSDNSILKVTT